MNQDKTHVVVAGGKILKTIRFESTTCYEDINIRTAVVDFEPSKPANVSNAEPRQISMVDDFSSLAQREMFDIEDVAWSNGPYKSYIATASSNGKVVLYDLERVGVRVAQLSEHQRQVHKVDFNPREGTFLLSGSQDGTVKLWDLRVVRQNVMTCKSQDNFTGRSDGVRHVKWSPTNTWSFCLGTDNGSVQRWDTRNSKAAALKISAHSGTCNSVDWHPDGQHLVSAGKDQNVRVWDIYSDISRYPQKPLWQLRTPYEVQNVRWRPFCFSTDPHDASWIKQCTHLATSYKHYPIVHIWDLRRPYIPFREVRHTTNKGTTDMMWRSKDLLLTVGLEGELTQSDIKYAVSTEDTRPSSIMAISCDNELTFFAAKRSPRLPVTDDGPLDQTKGVQNRADGAKSTEKRTLARSPGDDSYDEGFLASTAMRRSRTPSVKSGRSPSTHLPTAEDIMGPVTELDRSMQKLTYPRVKQHGYTIPLPGAQSIKVFKYLAYKYKHVDYSQVTVSGLIKSVEDVIQRNATYCERSSLHRDAQTWRILGQLALKELRQRMENNRAARLSGTVFPESVTPISYMAAWDLFAQSDRDAQARKSITSSHMDVVSNTTTPVARPIPGSQSGLAAGKTGLTDGVALPPVMASSNAPVAGDDYGTKPSPSKLVPFDASIFANPDLSKEEHDERRALVSEYRMAPKTPFSLDQHEDRTENITFPSRLDRADSNDSFLMFSNSSDSQPRLSGPGSFLSSDPSRSFEQRQQPQIIDDEDRDDRIGYVTGLSGGSLPSSTISGTQLEEFVKQSVDDSDYGVEEYATEAPPFVPDSDEARAAKINWNRFARDKEEEAEAASRAKSLAVPGQKDHSDDHVARKDTGKAKAMPMKETSSDATSQDFTLSDATRPDMTIPKHETPFTAIEVIKKSLEWYCEKGDAQTATTMYRDLAPMLAAATQLTNKLGTYQASTLSKSYVEYLTSILAIEPTVAMDVLVSQHESLDLIGISPAWIESFLSAYHEQLVALRYHNPAAELRNFAYPAFPAVYEQGLVDVQTGLVCTACKTPINNLTDKLRCETCGVRADPCPICSMPDSPYEDPSGAGAAHKTLLWAACLLCGHAAHSLCAFVWFGDLQNGGACPVAGCWCDCTPGTCRRERWDAEAAEEAARPTPAPSKRESVGKSVRVVPPDAWK